jgi:hypothetical protein
VLVRSSRPPAQPAAYRLTLSQSTFTPRLGSVGTSMNPFVARKGRTRISSLSGFSPTSYSTSVGQGSN